MLGDLYPLNMYAYVQSAKAYHSLHPTQRDGFQQPTVFFRFTVGFVSGAGLDTQENALSNNASSQELIATVNDTLISIMFSKENDIE